MQGFNTYELTNLLVFFSFSERENLPRNIQVFTWPRCDENLQTVGRKFRHPLHSWNHATHNCIPFWKKPIARIFFRNITQNWRSLHPNTKHQAATSGNFQHLIRKLFLVILLCMFCILFISPSFHIPALLNFTLTNYMQHWSLLTQNLPSLGPTFIT